MSHELLPNLHRCRDCPGVAFLPACLPAHPSCPAPTSSLPLPTRAHSRNCLRSYPYNLDFDYGPLEGLQKYCINNLGDPFIESNYGVHSREFEIGVLQWFARLWEIDADDFWGYITNCGTGAQLAGRAVLVGGSRWQLAVGAAPRECACRSLTGCCYRPLCWVLSRCRWCSVLDGCPPACPPSELGKLLPAMCTS